MISKQNKQSKALNACLANAIRLLDDAQFLEMEEPPATRYYLSLIAQEECAKAFLLYLSISGIIPWSAHLFRAMKDHRCKQLVAVVLDFLAPDDEEFYSRLDAAKLGGSFCEMPARVADALNILRHEKIGRWESRQWFWAEDPEWNRDVLKIAEGELDKQKQDSLYVRLARDGGLASTPSKVTKDRAQKEYERGHRFYDFVHNLMIEGRPSGFDFENIESAFRVLFSDRRDTLDT